MTAAKGILRLTSIIVLPDGGKFRNNLLFTDLRGGGGGVFSPWKRHLLLPSVSVPLILPHSPDYCHSNGTGRACGGSCLSGLRRQGCSAEDAEQGRGIEARQWSSSYKQTQWGEHKHLLLKGIPIFAIWLKAELSSLLSWGVGQTETPLKMIRTSTFLDSQEFSYDYSAGRSFSGNCGKVKSYSQKSLLCCLFILSDKRKPICPLDIQLYWLLASSLFLRTDPLISSVWATQRLN